MANSWSICTINIAHLAVGRNEVMEHQKTKKTANHHLHHHQTLTPTAAATSPSTSPDSQSIPGTAILPQEIIFDILLRVPVKSLLKFKTICKTWHSLITSQHFIKTHLSRSTSNPNLTHHSLLISSLHPHFNLKQVSFHSLLHRPTTAASAVPYPMNDPHKSVWLVGSCNGLFCIAIEENDLCIWNPSTRKSRKLPDSGIKLKFGCYVIYGFGYDSIGNDYKVVAIFCLFHLGGSYETEVSIFSLKTGSWRSIEGFEFGIPLDDSGKFVNGKLHWAVSRGLFGIGWHIACIDLGTEEYGVVEQPEFGDDGGNSVLAVSEGCLCLLRDYPMNRIDVWLMREYGVKDSWSKVVSVPYMEAVVKNYLYSPPLYMLRDGRFFIGYGSKFAIYDPVDTSLRYLEIDNFDAFLEAEIYVESLVSPDGDGGQVQQ